MMTLSVFTNSDCLSDYLSAMLLSVSPIGGGGVATFAYAIVSRGTYLGNIDNGISNCQVGGVEGHGEGALFHGHQLMQVRPHRFNYA